MNAEVSHSNQIHGEGDTAKRGKVSMENSEGRRTTTLGKNSWKSFKNKRLGWVNLGIKGRRRR